MGSGGGQAAWGRLPWGLWGSGSAHTGVHSLLVIGAAVCGRSQPALWKALQRWRKTGSLCLQPRVWFCLFDGLLFERQRERARESAPIHSVIPRMLTQLGLGQAAAKSQEFSPGLLCG